MTQFPQEKPGVKGSQDETTGFQYPNLDAYKSKTKPSATELCKAFSQIFQNNLNVNFTKNIFFHTVVNKRSKNNIVIP